MAAEVMASGTCRLVPTPADFESVRQGRGQVHGPWPCAATWTIVGVVPARKRHGEHGPIGRQSRALKGGLDLIAVPVRGRLHQPEAQHAIGQHPLEGSVRMMFGQRKGFELLQQGFSPR